MVKTWKNLYQQICSDENIRLAFRKARKGKSKKRYVRLFESHLDNELEKIKMGLESEVYDPQPLQRFIIRDPKTRVIHAPTFHDRVVHHAICNIIEPLFDKTFIHDSYASRKSKGTHNAIKRLDVFKRKVSRNGVPVWHAKDNNMIRGWALKSDIKHYFPSIDHNILARLLERKIEDRQLMRLLQKIISGHASFPGKGMPLGALTSQLFANIYLNPLDHFIKEKLKARFYLRYLDDFVILHHSRHKLEEWKHKIEKFLHKELELNLHSEKTSLFPLHQGVAFLGFRHFYHYRLLKKSNLRHLLRKLESMEDGGQINRSLQGWLAHASWGNTYKLRQEMISRHLS